MNAKLVPPLELMPPQLRHYVETVRAKYQHLGLNPTNANSTKLEKQYAVLENLWQELQWEQPLNDLQQREANLTQQQAARPLNLQQHLRELRENYVTSFQQRKRSLEQQKQHWEQRKQALRDSLTMSKEKLRGKSKLLSFSSEQLIEQQLQAYDSEWTSAEQRIEMQNMLLQQSEANYPIALQQHKSRLANAFEQLKLSLKEKQQNAPQALTQLQEQNAQRRSDLPGLVATWKVEAAAREMHYNAQLTSLRSANPSSSDYELNQDILTSKQLRLTERKASLGLRRQQLEARKQLLPPKMPSVPPTRPTSRPEAMRYAQLISELPRLLRQNSESLRRALHELVYYAVSSSELKMQLLTAGLLDQGQFPEIDAAWAELTSQHG